MNGSRPRIPRFLPGGIRARLFFLIALVLLPMLLLLAWVYVERYETRRYQTMQTELEVAQGVATTFAAYVDDIRRSSHAVGEAILTFERYTEEKATRLLRVVAAQYRSVRGLYWVSPNGQVLASHRPELVGLDFSDRAYFREILAGRPWAIGELTPDGKDAATPVFGIATAVRDAAGTLRGMVVAGVEPDRLGNVTLTQRRPAGAAYAIFDANGTVVYRSLGALSWEERVRWRQTDPLLREALRTGEPQVGEVALGVPGGRWLAARVPVPEIGWYVGAGKQLEVALAPVRERLIYDFALAALIAAVSFALAWLVARSIARPLLRMERDAAAMGAGEVVERQERLAPVEVRRLRASVAGMAADLLRRSEALRRSEERYRLVSQATNDIIWDWDLASDELTWNQALENVFGYHLAAVPRTIDWWHEHLHPDDRERVAAGLYAVIAGDGSIWTDEYRYRRADGGYASVLDRGHIHRDADGKPLRMVGSMLDVTERRQSEEALRTALESAETERRRLLAVLEALPAGVGIADEQGAIVLFNPALVRIWGRPPIPRGVDEYGDWKGRWAESGKPIAPEEWAMARALRTGEAVPGDVVTIERFDGGQATIINAAAPIRDADGRIVGGVVANIDITAQREAEERLRQSEESYRQLFTTITEGFALGEPIFDAEGKPANYRYLAINEAFLRQTGLTSEIVGRPITTMLPHLEKYWVDTYCKVAVEGEPIRVEQYNRDTDRWYDVYCYRPTEGRFAILFRNITAERQAREALRQSEAKFRAVFEQAAVGMAWVGFTDARWIDVNEAFCRMLGYSADEMRATPWPQMTHPADVDLDLIPFRRMAAGELDNYSVEKRFLHKEGHHVWARLTLSLVRDAEGHPDYEIAIIEDIGERKRAEARLRRFAAELERRVAERTADLEAANREMEAFSYTVSHDLRAPLRHIAGFIELLSARSAAELDEQGKKYLKIISEAAQRMGALIDDLLTFSRIARAPVKKSPVDLRALTEEVRRELAPEAAGRRIEWKTGDLPTVRADAVLLRTVVSNLLANALKYSRERDPAIIEIGCRLQGDEIVCTVRDNGAGFDMRYADKLFGVFQRLHRVEEFEGTGIGLASVQRIVHRHGGRTWAEGEVGRGATFYFSLPREGGQE